MRHALTKRQEVAFATSRTSGLSPLFAAESGEGFDEYMIGTMSSGGHFEIVAVIRLEKRRAFDSCDLSPSALAAGKLNVNISHCRFGRKLL